MAPWKIVFLYQAVVFRVHGIVFQGVIRPEKHGTGRLKETLKAVGSDHTSGRLTGQSLARRRGRQQVTVPWSWVPNGGCRSWLPLSHPLDGGTKSFRYGPAGRTVTWWPPLAALSPTISPSPARARVRARSRACAAGAQRSSGGGSQRIPRSPRHSG